MKIVKMHLSEYNITIYFKGKRYHLPGILSPPSCRMCVVLMYGPGFDAPEGNVRISLANLNSEDYSEIASRIMELLEEYYEEFKEDGEAKAA